ncbi:ABC transporter ATP-binding protein [Microbacterium azadirachtae]|uniref:ABC transporter ATP-binding protein n=1 Tax=Microbacterium azadirachtae TaxID=582680 RepID=UPI0008880D61|nr:ABC transporter ATP-binding protein [Microbacterium azadirachtae]SDL71183.1 iron complex transport system ATP-binding protein [Microbacterium azadirachtae]SEG00669.1 iron complex transport system ATP-binding protein [Microbacterium azadirachtae]SEG03130.1 iron complex transport system ATP-binding protein [Microbacterium azadirachtae]
MTHTLEARNLTVGYDADPVIDGLDLALPASGITMIVGGNGCGKSTLLRTLARLLKPRTGSVLLDGSAIAQLPTKEVARIVGLLPQAPAAPDGISVADLVDRGRTPHRGWLGGRDRRDDEVVADALHVTGMAEFAERTIDELSGGQRQRAWVAMALAQEPDILLLDEPTTYLDLAHQVELLQLLVRLSRERGTQVVVVMHELNLATRYADHLIAMRDGRVVAEGAPGDVVTVELLRDVFDLEAVVVPDPIAGTPMIVPVDVHRA